MPGLAIPCPLAHPRQTALDRASGQLHVVHAFANAITEIRVTSNTPSQEEASLEAEDLSDHPF